MDLPRVHAKDIQGIIVSGYEHLPCSSYHFLNFESPAKARRWLRILTPRVTGSERKADRSGRPEKPAAALNVALTFSGIRALGFPEPFLKTFSEEFRQGMAEGTRAQRLGDTGSNAPERWEFGGSLPPRGEEVHALLILQAPEPAALASQGETERSGFAEWEVRELVAIKGDRPKDAREHFGFRDGISQPEITGSPARRTDPADAIEPGEFILGYANSYGMLPPTPEAPREADTERHLDAPLQATGALDFGRNGSYLVFRKLQQDVAAFRQYFRSTFTGEAAQSLMAAKFVGRWPSGAPLTLAPNHDDTAFAAKEVNNSFAFLPEDEFGYRCPIGSHIRRTNPRDALRGEAQESLIAVNRHRILRRGASYGERLPEGIFEDDGEARGLLFLCVNADIKRQFEFVQQTWVNNPKFHGLYNDRDPVIGTNTNPDSTVGERHDMTIQAVPIRKRLADIPQFVTMRGGAYFFLPSIPALRFLAALA